MEVRFRLTVLRLIAAVAALVIIGVGGALLVAWTGVYNVAASRGHPVWLNNFLELGMRRSVEANSGAEPPDYISLDDPNLIQLGAAHYHDGCAPCHAAPGELINPIFEGMLPAPPRLEEHVGSWEDEDLHWIVLHGLQYAGMPAWSGGKREDEVWAIVTFLRRLPDLDRESYLALANRMEPTTVPIEDLMEEGQNVVGLTACTRCHDSPAREPASALVPALSAQSAEYIRLALNDYRENRRQSGIMEPVAAELSDQQIEQLADYFSSQPQPAGSAEADAQLVERGRQIAENGVPSEGTPACMSCHAGFGEDTYPLLAGLSAEYLTSQLRLFRNGQRSGTAQSDLMAQMAGGLEDEDILAVSAYFSSTEAAIGATATENGAP